MYLRFSLGSSPVEMSIPDAGTWAGPLRHFLGLSAPPETPPKRVRSSRKRSREPGSKRARELRENQRVGAILDTGISISEKNH